MKRIELMIAALIVAAAMAGCGTRSAKPGGKMIVAASIAPLANFSKEVGGNLVDVELIVPPNANPHTYQPEPGQMEALSKASVLVLNGIGLEFWADKVVGAAGNLKLIVVETAKGIPVIGEGEEHEEEVHPGGNPHVWLDPIDAIRQVTAIRDAFIKADPTHRAIYTANAARYIGRLRDLDTYIRAKTAHLSSRAFVTFHPSWVYFARQYGLVQAAVIEKSPGKEPSPEDIRRVIDTIKKLKAAAVFAEPQFSPKASEVIAEEAGAKVVFLDAFGQPPDYDYIKTMQANVDQMVKALE